MPAASDVFLTCYFLVLGVLCVYGLHRYSLVWLYYRHRSREPRLTSCFRELPTVTVQLPMYNEPAVARRIIEAAAALDYPRDRLEIQVLDDSTDDTVRIVTETVERLRQRGVDAVYLHRDDRTGFKAGALAEGLRLAKGQFLCVFDADFVPVPGTLRELIHYFADPEVGLVQARWVHLNRSESLLTKAQAVLLDGHFVIEHAARNRSGRFMSFNGTAGMWRRECIEDAGGWQHDTLTEDLDLSYRAQLKGWKFVYLPDVVAPAELPPEMRAFKVQQHRWTKGGAQTLRKLLPAIMRSRLPLRIKVEAFFHLTSCIVYLFMVALTMMIMPAVMLRHQLFESEPVASAVVAVGIMVLACFSAATFYTASQLAILNSWWNSIKYIPFLMCLGIGISLNNARATLSGFFSDTGTFERTPKYADAEPTRCARRSRAQGRRMAGRVDGQTCLELVLGFGFLLGILLCAADREVAGCIPFLALFMIGYLYVGGCSLTGRRVAAPRPASAPA
ncbi:MAG: glycosyltransferase [Phycisphaerales bacterium]|nr:MAG: glycosyltransferase [Phycisphaerales bacterium]